MLEGEETGDAPAPPEAHGPTEAPRPPPPPRPRRPRRPARRPRRRARRLHGRVPRRRPRAEDDADRALRGLGGVCLNVGCIPSKALLHAARVIAEAEEMAEHGIKFGKPTVDLEALRGWKQSVVDKLTGGSAAWRDSARWRWSTASARFTGPNTVAVGERGSRSTTASSPPDRRRRSLPLLPTIARIVTRPARCRRARSPSGCWSSAAASSASRWRPCTTRSARGSRWSSCSTS